MTNRKKIAFQGRPGANSHLACCNAYPDYEPMGCPTFEDAFAAVAAGEADLGMIPIENTVAGRVAQIHFLLRGIGQAADIYRLKEGVALSSSLGQQGIPAAASGEPNNGASPVHIVAEWFEPIRHQLLAPKGATLATIRTVESHVMALGQCRKKIRELGLAPIIVTDTAVAAGQVALHADKSRAAIASRLAAKIYDLEILAENIEDDAHNTTRFIVLSRQSEWAQRGGPVITSFVFQVRNVPAALYKALGGFATNGVNMTKLESHVFGERFSIAEFYADIEGHPDDPPVRLALEELAFFATHLKILGVYPAHPYRLQNQQPAG